MAYPVSKNRKAVTNALERDGFIARSGHGAYLSKTHIATIECDRSGYYFAVVKCLGFSPMPRYLAA